MLTPAVVRSASGAAGYYAADNYYTDGQATEASLWVGQGAEALELDGPVTHDAFEAVLAGSLPNGDTIPTGPNGKHRAGLDFTFSAPKSLSLLAYVGGDARLLAAHMAAVKTTVGWIEANLAEARVTRRPAGAGEERQPRRGAVPARHQPRARPDYADRFVADWRAASGERAAATGEDATWAAERKLERLVERMDQQPALERALDRQIPERQLEIDHSGITRTRDMDMGG